MMAGSTPRRIELSFTVEHASEVRDLLAGVEQLDLAGVEEIDTAGVQLLLRHRRLAEREGARFEIVRASPAVRSVLSLLRLEDLLGEELTS